jgi:hypothetical protein
MKLPQFVIPYTYASRGNLMKLWKTNIRNNQQIVSESSGPSLVTVVAGSQTDAAFWKTHLTSVKEDVFRQDGNTTVLSVHEKTRKGNFLGSLNAWTEIKQQIEDELPQITLISMVFGKGTRLSPFTQALGNRKPAFPVPMHSYSADSYLSIADISILYSSLWYKHLKDGGFKGAIIKWGDEAIIPGLLWQQQDYSDIDAFRFVWKTNPNEEMAREKEWIVIDEQTQLMKKQLTRQPLDRLKDRLNRILGSGRDSSVGVNLGSLAISYDFLNLATEIFKTDIENNDLWLDWDPYIWMALSCESYSEWIDEINHEQLIGKDGIKKLEERYPDFFEKVSRLKKLFEERKGRPMRVYSLDFGDAFWIDLGLHLSLREHIQLLLENSEHGDTARAIYGIDAQRDKNGNFIINSKINGDEGITNSIILDSVINDDNSRISNGIIIGSKCDRIIAPLGGIILFSQVKNLTMTGENAVVFNGNIDEVALKAGDRFTTIQINNDFIHLKSNEAIVDYSGQNYDQPILENEISFSRAADLISEVS